MVIAKDLSIFVVTRWELYGASANGAAHRAIGRNGHRCG
jgi:hypothetical protein